MKQIDSYLVSYWYFVWGFLVPCLNFGAFETNDTNSKGNKTCNLEHGMEMSGGFC